MSENLTGKTCAAFVEVLSTSAPVPGGGGAAALVGAIGVALGNMVGSLTVGKKTYAAVESEILALKAKSDGLQADLLDMVERDAEVFAPLARAYAIPKEDPNRDTVMEQVLREASSAPLEIMELCMEALAVVRRFSQIGSKLAVSDAGCAAACCRAALAAASLNVFINTRSMKDRSHADKLNAYAEMMLCKGTALADEIFTAVKAKLT